MTTYGPLQTWLRAACVAGLVSLAPAVFANPVPPGVELDRTEPTPKRLLGVDVRERPNQEVAKNARFTDENGRPATIADYLDGKHPVILTLNYIHCPMLCGLELNALVTTLKDLKWTVGKEFRVVTVILDPHETPAQTSKAKARYVREYGRPAADGWHFLTGSSDSIHAVAGSVGVTYNYNEARNEYVHPASIMLLTPDGRISRYLFGAYSMP